jgi:peptidylprolyl isomerase
VKHPRLRAATVVMAASALLLAGCGGSNDDNSATGPLADVNVSGGSEKKAPKVEVSPQPLSVDETTPRVIKEGDGPETTGSDIVMTDYLVLNGKDGSTLDQTYPQKPLGFDLSSQNLLPGLQKALTGQKIGSELLVAVPPKDAFGDQGNAQLKVGADDTLVFVLDLRSTVQPLDQAQGSEVKPEKGFPKVTWNDGKAASFDMPSGDPPKDTEREVLIKGKGDKVEKGDTVRVTYTGALYRNGKVFDSSFDHDGTFDFTVGQQQVINAWDTQLTGLPVGSRVVLVVPPKDGYGASGSPDGTIKGNDTIVFVIDILAAY